MSSSLQVAGLASNFDWKTFIDQMMSIERAPINRMNTEKGRNDQKVSRFAELGTKLTALENASKALSVAGLFNGRLAKSTTANSTWTATGASGAATGSYTVAVSQLATAAQRNGASDIGSRLSATSDVSGLTLANLPIASAITAGNFTVNGQKITVALTDSLEDVFTAISDATDGDVTASYDPNSDTISLTGANDTEVVLGAANDTSNFLRALKLSNNGTSSVESSAKLGTVKINASLASANLSNAITAVDGDGAGAFTINGVSIGYNVNTDSLSTILKRITASSAGVTANYDSVTDRVVLTNNTTGDVGFALNEDAGGLLGALGLTTGGTLVRGKNAEFTINGGATLTSTSNVLDSTAHGLTGLSITVDSETTQTIQVGADTTQMREKIQGFLDAFNSVQSFIESVTKTSTDAKGKVTASVLTDNREIQHWSRALRSIAFDAVPGLSGTVSRLEHLGIDFKSGTNELTIKDTAKLDAALADKANDVETFFQKSATGLAARVEGFVKKLGTMNTDQQTRLNKANDGLNDQIAAIERRLVQQRSLLETAFIAMEQAQANLNSQAAALTNALVTINPPTKR